MNNYKQIARHYIIHHRQNAINERLWFFIQPNFRDAIINAALAISCTGKRFHHQRRIPIKILLKCKSILIRKRNKLFNCRTFESLFKSINKYIGNIKGIGKLTVYDTAFRISGFLKLEPRVIFLHAGTEIGAQKIGLNHNKEYLLKRNIPKEFHILKPYEIEDILCIYKYKFNNKSNLRNSNCK